MATSAPTAPQAIVREALTNVRKQAPGAQVTVRVEYSEAQVRLTIR
jgi:signal transduction histidine kinase